MAKNEEIAGNIQKDRNRILNLADNQAKLRRHCAKTWFDSSFKSKIIQDLKDWVKNDRPYKTENNTNKVLKAIDDFDASYPLYTNRIRKLHALFIDSNFPESFNTYLYFHDFEEYEQLFDMILDENTYDESDDESDDESVSNTESESEID